MTSNYIYTKMVSHKEWLLHKYVYGLSETYGFHVPRPYSYDIKTGLMKMQRIPQMCVSDFYGALSTDVPEHVFTKIREILTILYNHRVYYPDITGYNFIEYNGHVWIIDFGHAYISDKFKDSFVLEFLHGLNEWNPDFL